MKKDTTRIFKTETPLLSAEQYQAIVDEVNADPDNGYASIYHTDGGAWVIEYTKETPERGVFLYCKDWKDAGHYREVRADLFMWLRSFGMKCKL